MSTLETVQHLLIERFGLGPGEVHADAKLDELGVDSLAALEFMFVLEERFGLPPSEPTTAARTVRAIAEEIDALIAQQSAPAALHNAAIET